MNDAGNASVPRAGRRRGGLSRWLLVNIVIPLAILAVAGGILVWFGEAQPAQLPPEDGTLAGRMKRLPLAQVTTVHSLDDFGGQLNLSVDGVVVPFREVQLASEVSGQIIFKDPACEAGNTVQQGQVLFRIDPTDYQLEVERLARLRDQEYQALKELDQETSNANRVLDVATQELELRERELQRLRSLPDNFASQSELDQAAQARLQAMQARVAAENQRDLLTQRRLRLESAERLAAVQLQAAEVNLQRTEIRAPIAGVIVREDAELNSFIQRGMPVVTIEDTSAAEVAVSLRMDQLYWVLDQQASTAMAAAEAPGRGYHLPETAATIYYEMAGREGAVYQWQGKLLRYDGIGLDEQTRTVPVRIVVEQPKRAVRADRAGGPLPGPAALVRGMFVRVVLHVQPRTPLMVIPAMALKPGNRIWQFQPDGAVLADPAATAAADAVALVSDAAPADSVSDPPPAADAPAADAPVADGAATFDPAQWVPGRVMVLEDVRPIEALRVGGDSRQQAAESSGQPAAVRTGPAGAGEKFWVCEVPASGLQAGDYAVVSPLATAGQEGSEVARVPIEQIKPTDVPQSLNVAAR